MESSNPAETSRYNKKFVFSSTFQLFLKIPNRSQGNVFCYLLGIIIRKLLMEDHTFLFGAKLSDM